MKSWPVLVGIAVVGSLCGVVIAGQDEPVGTVTAVPALIEADPATISSTSTSASTIDSSGGAATLASTTTSIVQSSPVVPTPSSTTTDDDGSTDTDRSTLRLVIAGADGRAGLADATAARLTTLGYGNFHIAQPTSPVEFTVIYFRSGFNRAAVAVATDLQADDPMLEELTDDAANPLTDADPKGDVIVLLGSDAPG